MEDLADWPTEEQAAAVLGVARKTIMRYIADGKIQKRTRPRPGRKPMNVCNPADVELLMPPAHVMPPQANGHVNGQIATPPPIVRFTFENVFERFVTLMENRLIAAPAPEERQLWLTLPEAAKFTGLTETYLRKIIKDGPLISCRGGKNGAVVISRSSLEALGRV
jgi:predicted DNA-binding transcriptional regulator AlpA